MQPTTELRFKQLDATNAQAMVGWSNERVIVIVDRDLGTVISNVIHELLHVVLHEDLENFMSGSLQEEVILAMEAHLWKYVQKSPRRLGWWRNAIKKKTVAGESA